MSDWLIAVIALLAGITLGALAGWLVRRVIRGQTSDIHDLAGPAATFMFWFFTAVGVVIAVGIVSPGSFDTVPQDVLAFLPSVLVAGLILLASWALAAILGRIMRRGVASASGGSGHAIELGVRFAVIAVGAVFALAQLGVDTTVLIILVGGVVGFGAFAAALLVGLGGRTIAAELASGRYLNRHLEPGAEISWPEGEGRVRQLHPVVMEVETTSGEVEFIPYSRLISGGFSKKP